MKKNELNFVRKDVLNWLERCLIGPFAQPINSVDVGTEEELPFRPSEMYQCGILYGQLPESNKEELLSDSEKPEDNPLDTEDEKWGVENENNNRQTASKTSIVCRYRPPSGVGLSFFVSSDTSIDVNVSASRYSPVRYGKQTRWRRRLLPDNGDRIDSILLRPSENDQQREESFPILSDHDFVCSNCKHRSDALHVKWRPYLNQKAEGYIVTISVQNTAELREEIVSNWTDRWEETHLFHVDFKCIISSGQVYPYPGNDMLQLDEEDCEFELLYSDKTVYAIGHGVAPDWETDESGHVLSINAAFLPSCEVPVMKTEVNEIDKQVLSLSTLAGIENDIHTVQKKLYDFIGVYEQWIRDLQNTLETMPTEHRKTAATILERLEKSVARMKHGIQSLTDPMVAKAFSFAHIAMMDYMETRGLEKPLWRPFQLGFFLQELPSLVNDNDVDRDLVDLLWFQTGGGKTEAYLSIISFIIVYRRMRYPENGGGTNVIMRYTLRLLTIQQFQRASLVICALELLRRKYPEVLGHEPISAGLWVGAESSPNLFAGANKILTDALNSEGYGLEKFVITECPWCGCPLRVDKDPLKSGFRWDNESFCFCCSNSTCAFGGSDNPVLPVNVVDQHLYRHPPSLLLATVDKFAMFAWKEETTVFLGNQYSTPLYSTGPFRPPELIIQDELHLIAGELGTIAGLYEAGFDTALKLKNHTIKYIASTATIRNARDQVRKLYSRDISVFPSPGLNWSDSFFARVDHEKPGRLYIGYYNPNHGRQESFAPLGAALFTAPSTWKYTNEAIQDAWWTVVAYHGSLRGIGITHNLLGDEVGKYMNYYIHYLLDDDFNQINDYARSFTEFCDGFKVDKRKEDYKKKMYDKFIDFRGLYSESGTAELTSNRNASEIRKYLSDLETSYSSKNNKAISTLLCTNMVSVGLDIARLGLMVINGQPFTTGEYIQASSRVGRNQTPGIVVAHYFRNHARDMSHYENFRAYHESFYRFVEPTSLTPFSAPSRQRALHAAVVILMRHGVGLLLNDMADRMNSEDENVKKAVDIFLDRCKKASPNEYEKTKEHVVQLLYHWQELSGQDGWVRRRLQYDTPHGRKDKKPLLIRYNDSRLQGRQITSRKDSWRTLQSMRNVDEECAIVFVAPR
jgi:hypothetical protein